MLTVHMRFIFRCISFFSVVFLDFPPSMHYNKYSVFRCSVLSYCILLFSIVSCYTLNYSIVSLMNSIVFYCVKLYSIVIYSQSFLVSKTRGVRLTMIKIRGKKRFLAHEYAKGDNIFYILFRQYWQVKCGKG